MCLLFERREREREGVGGDFKENGLHGYGDK